MAQKPVLGKGLASLLPGTPAIPPAALDPNYVPGASGMSASLASGLSSEIANRDRFPGISLANPEEIVTNPYQPRREFDEKLIEELAQSISENGIIQPITVRKTSKGYELIAGERRLRAVKKLGLKQVPIVIRKASDREALELALIENIQRENLNCIDEALAYFQLQQEFSLSQEEIARRVGKERATVANYLRLLKLPEAVIQDLKDQKLSFGHGKALLSANDHLTCMRAREQALERRLSVRDLEALVQELNLNTQTDPRSSDETKATEPLDPLKLRLRNLALEIGRKLSLKAEIKGSDKSGKIVMHYRSREELDRVLQSLQIE